MAGRHCVLSTPLGASGLQHGPVIMRDQRFLFIPEDHPLANKALIDPEDLKSEKLTHIPLGAVNDEWRNFHLPRHIPKGHPIGYGPEIETVREAIAVVGPRKRLVTVAARAAAYFATQASNSSKSIFLR